MSALHEAAQAACQQIGVIYESKPTDGGFHYLDAEGKSPRNGAGRIRLYADGEGGQVWNHVTSDTLQFWAKSEQTFTPAEAAERLQRAKEEREKAEALLAEERAAAAALAATVWKVATSTVNSVYFDRKQVTPTGTIKEMALDELAKMIGYHPAAKGKQFSGDKVQIIPVSDSAGITTIEMIDETGLKAGLKNGQKKGCFWSSHKLPKADSAGIVIGIGEGVATMLTYHAASGNIGIAALSCGNLKAVALYFRNRYPAARIEIVSDIGNGERAALDAVRAVDGWLIKPTFADGSTGTDINDLMTESGLQAVKDCLQQARQIDPIDEPSPDAGATTATTTESNTDSLTEAVNRLAKLSPLEYDKVRKEQAKALGVRPGTLDAAIKGARKEESSESDFEVVEPWPEPVDGAALLTTIATTIRRFIICEPHTAQSVALWVAMTWFIEVIQVAPLAVITAPEKRCGKSMLLFLIGRLVPRPLMSSSISPSALFRSIDAWQPTLLIDEVDACLKDNEELRGLINCGHTRDSAFVVRCVGDDHEPKRFRVWGAKCLSGIGHVADTLMDRSIILELRRKLSHESVDRIRHAEPGLFIELCQKLARFADDNSERVRLARPDLPPSLNDRAQDNWEPLLAIATVAGGDWFKIGTAAALKLSGGESLSMSIGTELLADIQEIFEHKKIDRITTAELIKELTADDEKPWNTYNKGFQIKPRQIAAKLKGYGIHSKTIRIGFETAKGYEKDQFLEAFSRYIPVTPLPSVTTSQTAPQAALPVTDNPSRYSYESEKETRKPASIQGCDAVTDKDPFSASEVIDLTGTNFEVMA